MRKGPVRATTIRNNATAFLGFVYRSRTLLRDNGLDGIRDSGKRLAIMSSHELGECLTLSPDNFSAQILVVRNCSDRSTQLCRVVHDNRGSVIQSEKIEAVFNFQIVDYHEWHADH